MAGLSLAPPFPPAVREGTATVTSSATPLPAPALSLDDINPALEQFFADWEAAARPDGATWLSLERFRALTVLLDGGSDVLARSTAPASLPDERRRRYGANLRRLLPLLLQWQREMTEAARRLDERRSHQQALRRWLALQRS